MSIPGVQDPKIPLGIELGISQLVATGIESLKKELNYGKPVYTDASPADTPNTLASFIASAVGTTGTGSTNTINIPTAGGTV
jgi:hypothetical protein